MESILATEGVPGYVFGRIRAYREEHPESWRADQTAVYGEPLIAAYEQWERRQQECQCYWVDPSLWTTHYGAVEPGSQIEWNPDCPQHGDLS